MRTMTRIRRAFARHRALAAGVGAGIAALAVLGFATGAEATAPYLAVIAAGALLVAAVEPDAGFSALALGGLSLWALGHMAGGTVGIGDGRTLYNAVVAGVHADNAVHFIGFGAAGLLWSEVARARWAWGTRDNELVLVAASTWLAGMGVGAFNEVVEFFATLVLPNTNVGGYHNTGRDLVANMLGAAVAAAIATRRVSDLRRARPAAAGGPRPASRR